ncbi:MAG: hypothetical protein Tsb0010_18340 [Parvularculaceae bacterium]
MILSVYLRRYGAVALVSYMGALGLLATGPAAAQGLRASEVRAAAAAATPGFETPNTVTELATNDASSRIYQIAFPNNLRYLVTLSGCSQAGGSGVLCSNLTTYFGLDFDNEDAITYEEINAWNGFSYSQSYKDSDGDPILNAQILAPSAYSKANLDAFFANWGSAAIQFTSRMIQAANTPASAGVSVSADARTSGGHATDARRYLAGLEDQTSGVPAMLLNSAALAEFTRNKIDNLMPADRKN